MNKRFGALRFIGGVFKVIGVILGVIAVAGSLGICITSIVGGSAVQSLGNDFGYSTNALGLAGAFGGILSGLVVLITVGLAAVSEYAIGEAISLFLAIEENTRATAAYIARQTAESTPHA